MVTEWQGDDVSPYTGKSEIFKRPAPEVREALMYQASGHRFPIVRDPLTGLNSSQGPVDEKGWPILTAS